MKITIELDVTNRQEADRLYHKYINKVNSVEYRFDMVGKPIAIEIEKEFFVSSANAELTVDNLVGII